MAIQYTVRNVPKEVDRALRKRAKEGKVSLNQVILEALTEEEAKPRSTGTFPTFAAVGIVRRSGKTSCGISPNSLRQLTAQLHKAVRLFPDNDLWIAALVLQHALALATRDKRFQLIGQLHLI